jgi:hypothetical protein
VSHGSVIVLLVVVRLVLICPDVVVVFVKFIVFLNDFARTDFNDLFIVVAIISSSSLFALAFLRLFLFAFALGCAAVFVISVATLAIFVIFIFNDTFIESFDIFGGLSSFLGLNFLNPLATVLEHFLLDLVLFHVEDLLLYIVLSIKVLTHVGLLDFFSLKHCSLHLRKGTSLGLAGHA